MMLPETSEYCTSFITFVSLQYTDYIRFLLLVLLLVQCTVLNNTLFISYECPAVLYRMFKLARAFLKMYCIIT